MSRFSSGTSDSATIFHPYSCAAFFRAGPPKSSYKPFEARSEIVIMPTEISITMSPSPHRFRFRHQSNASDLHAFIHSFAHVVNGQACHAHCCEGFHFYTRLRGNFGGGGNNNPIPGPRNSKIDFAMRERKRMTKRDQFAGL